MATTAQFTIARPYQAPSFDLRANARVIMFTLLVPGLFGAVNLGAESIGILPLFFAPFGLPGWAGGAIHLMQLALLGAAFGILTLTTAPQAKIWLATLIAAYIALPFITPPLESLPLSMVCTAIFLLALAALRRVGMASALAGWLMTPILAVVGFSAVMGLMMTAAYAPPFALINGNNSATSPA